MKRFTLLVTGCLVLAACKSNDAPADSPPAPEPTSSEAPETGESEGAAEAGEAGENSTNEGAEAEPAATNVDEPQAEAPSPSAALADTDGAAIRTDGELPLSYLGSLPAGAAMYAAVDADALIGHYAATRGIEADEQRVLFGRQLGPLFASDDVPEELRGNIRLENARAIAMAAWEDDSIAVVTDPDVLSNAPAEGELLVIAETTVSVRGGRLFIGTGPQFAAMLEGEAPRFNLEASWSEGVAQLPTGASVVLALPTFSTLEEIPAALNSVRRVLFATGMGTESALVFDSDIDADLRGYLGRAQQEATAGLEQMRMMAPPFAQAWVGYIDLVVKSLWSQVSLETEGTMTVLGIDAPRCGSIGSLHLAALLAGVISAGATELQGPLVPFEPVEQRLQDGCAPVPGPRPNLPRSFAGMPGDGIDGDRVVAMMDLGALMRENLPTLFQLLPYSLHPDDVIEALGATPLGLNGLDDANGVLGGYVLNPMGQPEEAVVILPAGTAGYLPIPTPPGFTQSVVDDVGNVFAMEGSEELVEQRLDTESPWGRLVHSLPAGTVLSLAATQPMLAELASDLPQLPSLLRDAQVIAIAVDADLNLTAHFYVGTNAQVLEETTRQEIAESLEEALGETSDEGRAIAEMMFGQIRDSILVGSEMDDIVHISISPEGGQLGGMLGITSAIMVPAMISYREKAEAIIEVYPDPSLADPKPNEDSKP